MRWTLHVSAITVGAIALSISLVSFVRWIQRPSPNSAEGLLARADDLAWNNNWLAAFPLYVRAERSFEAKGDRTDALYAHVSQFAVRMESSELSTLIAELNADLASPTAAKPETRLRVLEMKAKCEEEYDASLAKQTFSEVERLALKQHKFYLASRASGEIGILAFTLGDLTDAATRVKRAYAVAKFLGDPAAHVRYAEMIGLGLQQLGRPKQALVFLNEAIATQERHTELAQPYVAFHAKVDSLADLGRYEEALALADQALVYPRAVQFYGQLQALLTSRGDVLLKAGKTNEAVSSYQEALADAKKVQSWRAIDLVDGKLAVVYERMGLLPRALSAIEEAIDANKQTPSEIFLVPGNLAVKARIQAELGRRADAEEVYLKAADVLDALLAHVPTPETERLLLSELGDLYSGYFQLLSDDGRTEAAFDVIERAHGRVEAQELEYNQTAIPRYADSGDVTLHELELRALKTDARQDRMVLIRQMLALKNAKADWIAEEQPASLRSVQRQLQPEELLIEYVLGSPHSYALAITRSNAKRYTLPDRREIERDASKYRDSVRKQKTDFGLGQRLFYELLSFTSDYRDSNSLLIAADGELHLLPFSALLDQSGRYVLETKTVSMTPSGTVLNLLRSRTKNRSSKRPYLGVAPWTESHDDQPWVLRAITSGSTIPNLPPLPQSRDEVRSIAAIAPQPSTVLIGPEATKQKFQSLPLNTYRVLHLALHGLVDPVFPDRSVLVFAPTKGDDGHLEARDIRRLHLRAELVTLSACDTGIGPVGAAGIESLDTAFIDAGASSVVSTLWELEDRSSDKLMKAFYTHLKDENEGAALRDAKLDLLHSGVGPYYWASYELDGDPSGRPFATE